ncbi:MAG TPA: SDR family NAD(P)-dependent oxidoreductase, partial [Chryseolinea sp.]|nr:SDR family NAD(P)-dependent oxidoreductase [Chryseolinea sp.]
MNNLFDLSGRTAVITGGTGVLGSAMAHGLADAGANTVIIGRKQEAANKIIRAIQSKGHKSTFIAADVLDEEQLL